jgi:hypothetical protein
MKFALYLTKTIKNRDVQVSQSITTGDHRDIYDVISQQKVNLYSSLDLRAGYQQIMLDPATAHKTAFQTHEGKFVYNRQNFGLCNAESFFQMVISNILADMTSSAAVLIYVDDILVLGKTPEQMLERLQQVFDHFRQARLRIHPAKCRFSVSRVLFLGHELSPDGVAISEEKIKVVKNYPRPTSTKLNNGKTQRCIFMPF